MMDFLVSLFPCEACFLTVGLILLPTVVIFLAMELSGDWE